MTRYRNTWAEIDIHAIRHNVEHLRRLLPKGRKVMGVVKADGYGHGSVAIAKTLVEMDIDHLMVAYLEEAIHLRKHGITVPVLVIGRVSPSDVQVAIEYDITLAVSQREWIEQALAEQINGRLNIHIEFETGFNRTGVRSLTDITNIVDFVKASEDRVIITGAYTHFATADDIKSTHYVKQKKTYEQMLAYLSERYDQPIITHIGNSAAGIQYPEQMKQYTRFGVSLYGLYPSPAIKRLNKVELKQAFSLYSELIEVKHISQGEYVSYGNTYEAEADEWIGTIPIGYADGWPRSLQGFHVLVDGKQQEIVGRICMDMLMVRLDKKYAIGEKVTLIGRNKDAVITMDDVAEYLNTINYEIPCMITSRVPREYINENV